MQSLHDTVMDFRDFPRGSTLHRCGPGGFAALSAVWTEAVYAPDATVVTDEDTTDDVYFILSGRARAATYTDEGREVRLADLDAGEGFGLFAAIDGGPRSTNVTAIEESRLARISARRFNAVIDAEPAVARALMIYLVERIRELSARMTELTTCPADERLGRFLLRLSRREGPPPGLVVRPLPKHHEIASMIFSQREAVGRELARLERAGLIRRPDRRTVAIPDPDALIASYDRR